MNRNNNNKKNNNTNTNDMLEHLIFRWASQLNEINNTNNKIQMIKSANIVRKEMLKILSNLGYFDKQ